MLKISINKNLFSDLLNLYYGVFYPINHFVNKEEFLSILLKKNINKKFFPLPIFFGISRECYKKIKNEKLIQIFYKKKYLALINIKSFFKINTVFYGKKAFGKNFNKNPYYKKFKKENFIYIDFVYKKLIKKNLHDKNFISPKAFKNNCKKNSLAGFHTRNAPHAAHQWAHQLILKKYKNLLIQPLLGQYKKNEYSDKTIIQTNKRVLKIYKKNCFFLPYFSYPRYGGPLEAALHAIVRKNYGCTHFWVGRDHAGYKKNFSKYESQKFCLKIQKKLGIKIIAEKEPYFCSGCKKIVNKKCSNKICKKSKKKFISGTEIRKLIKNNYPIPNYMMDKRVSILIKKKKLIN